MTRLEDFLKNNKVPIVAALAVTLVAAVAPNGAQKIMDQIHRAQSGEIVSVSQAAEIDEAADQTILQFRKIAADFRDAGDIATATEYLDRIRPIIKFEMDPEHREVDSHSKDNRLLKDYQQRIWYKYQTVMEASWEVDHWIGLMKGGDLEGAAEARGRIFSELEKVNGSNRNGLLSQADTEAKNAAREEQLERDRQDNRSVVP